jgi:hypothetical protein
MEDESGKHEPWWIKPATVLLFLNTLIGGIVWTGVSRGWWSSPSPTSTRTYDLLWRGGRHTYVTPVVGRAFDAAIPLQFFFLLVIFLGAWVADRRKNRVAKREGLSS